MNVVIAGAGIGGLTAALALHAAGITHVDIYESTAELRPLGVGINLLPHAVRELTELGLAGPLAEIGVPTSTLSYFNRYGQEIWSEPRGFGAGYHWPQYSIHRGRLQLMLRDVVLARLGSDSLHLGHKVDDVQDEGARTSVRITGADGTTSRIVADVVIAADGIHSAVRRQRYPDEGQPLWNGLLLWRGTARARPYLDGRTMIMAGDGLQKFVAYPLSAPGVDGKQDINFIAEYRTDVDWSADGVESYGTGRDSVLPRFKDWDFGWLDVPGLISMAQEIIEYPMVDREPVDQWTYGHQTLLGDAAHAMYPIGSNGASQAIIDARTLAHALATSAGVDAALQSYESTRRPLTAGLTLSNRKLGPERVMQLAFERAPDGFDDIEGVVTYEERAAIANEYKVKAGFLPEDLNNRATLSV